MAPSTVLVSGGGIAGQVTAFWLARAGHAVTVVERAPSLRQTGGHAVDLAGPTVEVIERMGLLPAIRGARVRRDRLRFMRTGREPLTMPRLSARLDDQWIEIQRDDLTRILSEASADLVDLRFGDSISRLAADGAGVEVGFEHGHDQRFDLVIGADGLHSMTRRLAFGPPERFRHFLGGYLSVFSYPNELGLGEEVVGRLTPGRAIFTYPIGSGKQARVLFLFREAVEYGDDHRDVERQRQRLADAFAGGDWETPRLLAHARSAADFYFDSITQIRMDSWVTDRIALVGDAGFSPGPAVGGGTALAVLSGYVLARQLAAAGSDHAAGLARYQDSLRDAVAQSRKVGPSAIRQLVPATARDAAVTPWVLKLAGRLPQPFVRALFSLGSDRRTLDDFVRPVTAGVNS